MATHVVKPAPDGIDMRGNWVAKSPSAKTNHVKKSAALRKVRERASEGDTIIAKKTNGQLQAGYPKTYRGGRSGASRSNNTGVPGIGAIETGISDAFDR